MASNDAIDGAAVVLAQGGELDHRRRAAGGHRIGQHTDVAGVETVPATPVTRQRLDVPARRDAHHPGGGVRPPGVIHGDEVPDVRTAGPVVPQATVTGDRLDGHVPFREIALTLDLLRPVGEVGTFLFGERLDDVTLD